MPDKSKRRRPAKAGARKPPPAPPSLADLLKRAEEIQLRTQETVRQLAALREAFAGARELQDNPNRPDP